MSTLHRLPRNPFLSGLYKLSKNSRAFLWLLNLDKFMTAVVTSEILYFSSFATRDVVVLLVLLFLLLPISAVGNCSSLSSAVFSSRDVRDKGHVLCDHLIPLSSHKSKQGYRRTNMPVDCTFLSYSCSASIKLCSSMGIFPLK